MLKKKPVVRKTTTVKKYKEGGKKVYKPGTYKSGNKTVHTSKSGVQYTKEVIPGKQIGTTDIGGGISIPKYEKSKVVNTQKNVPVFTKSEGFISGKTLKVTDAEGKTTTKYFPGSGRAHRVKVTDSKGKLLYYKDDKGVRYNKSTGTEKPVKTEDKKTKTQEEMAKMNSGSSSSKNNKSTSSGQVKATVKKEVVTTPAKAVSSESAWNNTKRMDLLPIKIKIARKAMPTITDMPERVVSTPTKAKVKELRSDIKSARKANRQEARTNRKVNRLEKKLERVKGTKMKNGGVKKPAVKMYKKGGKK